MTITKSVLKNTYQQYEVQVRGTASGDSSVILLTDLLREDEVSVSSLNVSIHTLKYTTNDTSTISINRGNTSIGIFNGSSFIDYSNFGMSLGNNTAVTVSFNSNGNIILGLRKNSGYSQISSTTLEATVLGLFANGERGVWYDPSDLSTMFQDSSGTIPVTTIGDPVGKILDKSGNNNHAIQTTSGKRPILGKDSSNSYYLIFDGVTSALVTSSINFDSSNQISIFAGVRKISDSSAGMIAELSVAGDSNNGAFYLQASNTNLANYRVLIRGTSNIISTFSAIAPTSTVISAMGTLANASNFTVRKDAAQIFNGKQNFGQTSLGNYPLHIGARNQTTARFNGYIYNLIIRNSISTSGQITTLENYCNSKVGAY